jgi:hypothetical protein
MILCPVQHDVHKGVRPLMIVMSLRRPAERSARSDEIVRFVGFYSYCPPGQSED